MDDDTVDDDTPAPPPGFRPWAGGGVAQPGADRPRGAGDAPASPGAAPPPAGPPGPPGSRMGPYPTSAYAVQPSALDAPRPGTPPAYAVPTAHRPVAAPVTNTYRRTRLDGGRVGIVLALLAVGTAWLPWLKSPTASLLNLNGSGFDATANAWDVAASVLWSYRSGRGGPSLGWVVVGVSGAMVVAFLLRARGVVRLVAVLTAAVAIAYLVQIGRAVADSSTRADVGLTDLVGLGPYLLLLLAIGVLLVPPR